jgi:hypothetical protein
MGARGTITITLLNPVVLIGDTTRLPTAGQLSRFARAQRFRDLRQIMRRQKRTPPFGSTFTPSTVKGTDLQEGRGRALLSIHPGKFRCDPTV